MSAERPRAFALESTQAEPGGVETVDILGPAARDRRPRAEAPPRPTPERDRICIGRYKLLEVVGSGGMGVVWGAWDPDLERRVALKILRPTLGASARQRIVEEGQTLARLSHPNVVPIFDVGVMGDEVFLVMEWVRGTTLRAFAAEAPGRAALLDAYRQAGEGLAAAHRAGVIHRDFKPDNAIRGHDGRVRVLDFGLACDEDDGPATVAGTPRYMAPEQARGDKLTAAADQYAFAASLREALGEPCGDATASPADARPRAGSSSGSFAALHDGRRSGTPAWIRAILERALAPAAADRFPAMDDVLAALAADPARRWRRRAVAGLLAVSAGCAFVVGRSGASGGHEAAAIEPCTGGADEIAATWSPATRTHAATHLTALGALADEEVARALGRLDAHRDAWVGEQRRTCLAREAHQLTPNLYEVRAGCLARSRAALAAVAGLLANATLENLAPALVAAGSLPDVQMCATMDASRIVPPDAAVAARVAGAEARVEQARSLAIANDADAIAASSAALVEARATSYPPLLARALLVAGRAKANVTPKAAAALLEEAVAVGLRANDDALAVEAYARWLFVSRSEVVPEGAWPVMHAVAGRTGEAGRFARALLHNNRAATQIVANDPAAARASLRIALAEAEGTGEIELASIAMNLALVEEPARREDYARRAVARLTAGLGPVHPQTLDARILASLVGRDLGRSRDELERACRAYERWQHPVAATCAFDAALFAAEAGDDVAAAAWMRRAAEGHDDHARVAAAYGDAGALERIAGELAAAPQWWLRGIGATAYIAAARAAGRTDPARAERAWAGALAALDGIAAPLHERRRAWVRGALAEHWAATRPREARELAAQALTWYRGTTGTEGVVARLVAIAPGR